MESEFAWDAKSETESRRYSAGVPTESLPIGRGLESAYSALMTKAQKDWIFVRIRPCPRPFSYMRNSSSVAERMWKTLIWLALAALLISLVIYSVTIGGVADGGFHLVAAQLILAGKRPYLDFFSPRYL